MSKFDYDVVIVGAGAGGGVATMVLAEAGKHVLLLERGTKLNFSNVKRDHLRNQRFSAYGHNAGPFDQGFPRVNVDPITKRENIVRPHEPGYDNNAACVGSGTVVYGAQAWRFMPQDFRMASIYGVPDGSSLADWPISYDDLEPYYDRAEWELGVSGDASAGNSYWPRQRGYPMPPVPSNPQKRVLLRGAEDIGISTQPVPLAINTVPYGNRPACTQCSYCVGFACPVDAKNGSQNTMIPRALATGLCDLQTDAVAERIEVDGQGNVTGVTYLADINNTVERRSVRARAVIVSGGAVETARLLLHSSSAHHPAGLGNAHDLVGRNYCGHHYISAVGLFGEVTQDGLGPGPSLATCDYNHGNDGIIGGGMLANEFTKLPVMFWNEDCQKDTPRWGLPNKQFMRDAYTRTVRIAGPVHDIPVSDDRVTLDPSVRDRFGIPVARMSGIGHTETVKAAQFMRERAEEWLRASGAKQVSSGNVGYGRTGGQHQSGTCRMGTDPKTSVSDSHGRIHGHDNLFAVDGSLHVTNGGLNPFLTIMALAFRNAEYIARTI